MYLNRVCLIVRTVSGSEQLLDLVGDFCWKIHVCECGKVWHACEMTLNCLETCMNADPSPGYKTLHNLLALKIQSCHTSGSSNSAVIVQYPCPMSNASLHQNDPHTHTSSKTVPWHSNKCFMYDFALNNHSSPLVERQMCSFIAACFICNEDCHLDDTV